MKRWMAVPVWLALLPATSFAQAHNASAVRVALVKMPYVGERNIPELSGGPDYLQQGGIQKLLEEHGFQAKQVSGVTLNPDEDKAYGSRNLLPLPHRSLANLVSNHR